MSKFSEAWWQQNKRQIGDTHANYKNTAKAWQACKAEAIRLFKAEIHVNISKKKRSIEKILEDL